MSVGLWTVKDVASWVDRIPGLSMYSPLFTLNEIDGATLLGHLSKDDLREEIGIRNLRDRQLLWEAIESLRYQNRLETQPKKLPAPVTRRPPTASEVDAGASQGPTEPPPFQMPQLRYLPRPSSASSPLSWYAQQPRPAVDLSACPPMGTVNYRTLLEGQQQRNSEREEEHRTYQQRTKETKDRGGAAPLMVTTIEDSLELWKAQALKEKEIMAAHLAEMAPCKK